MPRARRHPLIPMAFGAALSIAAVPASADQFGPSTYRAGAIAEALLSPEKQTWLFVGDSFVQHMDTESRLPIGAFRRWTAIDGTTDRWAGLLSPSSRNPWAVVTDATPGAVGYSVGVDSFDLSIFRRGDTVDTGNYLYMPLGGVLTEYWAPQLTDDNSPIQTFDLSARASTADRSVAFDPMLGAQDDLHVSPIVYTDGSPDAYTVHGFTGGEPSPVAVDASSIQPHTFAGVFNASTFASPGQPVYAPGIGVAPEDAYFQSDDHTLVAGAWVLRADGTGPGKAGLFPGTTLAQIGASSMDLAGAADDRLALGNTDKTWLTAHVAQVLAAGAADFGGPGAPSLDTIADNATLYALIHYAAENRTEAQYRDLLDAIYINLRAAGLDAGYDDVKMLVLIPYLHVISGVSAITDPPAQLKAKSGPVLERYFEGAAQAADLHPGSIAVLSLYRGTGGVVFNGQDSDAFLRSDVYGVDLETLDTDNDGSPELHTSLPLLDNFRLHPRDAAAATVFAEIYRAMMQQAIDACAGLPDVTGDDLVSLPDLLGVLAVFGEPATTPDTHAADVDDSGAVDLADLLDVLASFGQDCY